MADNKKIKLELTIKEDLNTDEFLEELNDWMIKKNFINPLFPINESPKEYRRKRRKICQ